MRRPLLSVLTAGTLVLGLTIVAPAGAASAAPPDPGGTTVSHGKGDFDVREGGSAAEKKRLRARAAALLAKPAVSTLSTTLGQQGIVDIDPLTATPREVAKLDGFLTGPSSASAADVALGYVDAHQAAFGLTEASAARLHLTRDYVDIDGLHHLFWTQSAGGIPVFGNGLRANVTADGRLISVQGSPLKTVSVPGQPVSLTGADAVRVAKRDLGEQNTAPEPADTVTKVLFATPGGIRIAWRTITMSARRPALHVVDAETGRLLFRENLTSDANPTSGAPTASSGTTTPIPSAAPSTAGQLASGHALVFDNYPGAPRGGTQKDVDLVAHGWIRAGASTLTGNNAHTYTDVNSDDVAEANEDVQPRAGGSFQYPQIPLRVAGEPCATNVCTWLPDKPYSWLLNRDQTATQNFYFVNKYHDHLAAAPIGFTEAAGNFQTVNTTGQGAGGDAVLDEPLDGASIDNGLPDADHIDNANFATPPDGTAPRMQMYLWHQPGTAYPDEDPFIASSGSDEADIVYHEYTHGLSHRLVVDASDVPALDSVQGASMGEAWSDWYALDYLVGDGLIRDSSAPGDVEVGRYVLPSENFRTEPTDCLVTSSAKACPGTPDAGSGGYTYGDFGKISGFGPEVHADGEIWAQTLWQLRDRLGSKLSESLVTRAMELSPTYPSFLDMRNAIVQADVAIYGSKHLSTIWQVFASRGMGFFAGTVGGDDLNPVESFALPPAAGSPTSTLLGVVVDATTHRPIAGAVVAFGGHDSGFPGSYATTTGALGQYAIPNVFRGRYPDVYASGPGFDTVTRTLTVSGSRTVALWQLRRDWAAAGGGATIAATNGDEYADFGCGAAQLIDQSSGVGWSADLPADATGKYAVIRLPKAITLTSITVDPANTCGDDASASTAAYRIETSRDGTTYTLAAAGTFTDADRGRANAVPVAAAAASHVQYIRYTMLTSQAGADGVTCTPDPGGAGCLYVDTSELEAYGG